MIAAHSIVLPLGRGYSIPVLFIGAGFLPVLSLVFHCLGLISMPSCFLLLVFPAFAAMVALGAWLPAYGRLAWAGWLAGLLAVGLYDLSRIPYILYGWKDFIPNIGAWLSGTHDPDALIGYAWRYIGNGGGMGISFFVLLSLLKPQKRLLLTGLIYGLFVFVCLMSILLIFDEAQRMMFRITAVSFTGSLTGHVIYGLVLGLLARRYFRQQALTSSGR
ncbi:MAG: hypothetical protein AB1458_07150 [Bacteroidota bacterium]